MNFRHLGSRSKSFRLSLNLLFAFGLLSLASSPVWSSSSTAVVEGAKKEGKLVWYTALNIVDSETLLTRFRTKYPFIETKAFRAGSEDLLIRILAEHRADKHAWDVAKLGGIKSIILKQKGLFAPYVSAESKFFSNDFKDPQGYWTSIYHHLQVVAYNTRLVSPKEAPKSWDDLLDPKWRGKMGMTTDSSEWFANMLKVMGEEKGVEYMKRLQKQNLQFRRGNTLLAQLVTAGEVSIGIRMYPPRIEKMKEEGAPIEWQGFAPVIPLINPIAISAYAPHPNAARLFVDFLLSREGQELIASMSNVPTRLDVDPIVMRFKKGLNILPFDEGLIDDFQRYVKLYRDMNFK